MSETVTLTVTGMKCGGCEANVSGKLQALAGVLAVEAKHKENAVTVTFDADKTDVDTIEDVIIDAGFKVE